VLANPVPLVHIVDDDEAFRASIAFLLETAAMASRQYRDGAAFLKALPQGHGCLILDLAMPDLSGLDLQEQLQMRGYTMPIVFLTAYGDVRSGVKAMRRGAEDFLTKPVAADELLDAVGRALARDLAHHQAHTVNAALDARASRLTPREYEVLRHVIAGRLNKQIASDLGLALQTIKFHRGNIMAKLEANSVADLALIARALDIPPVESASRC
jgi:FixJ family two-component response regulator